MDAFVGVKKITLVLKPNIFLLDWSENSHPVATWVNKRPIGVTFETTINWRTVDKIMICSCDTDPDPFDLPKELFYHNIALLKSLLQKYVRRQMCTQALQTAWHLIKLDVDAFLRRIFVIMLEDVSLHASVSVIAWLTSAISKGYKLQAKHIAWLLGLTQYLCLEKCKSFQDAIMSEHYDTSSILRHSYGLCLPTTSIDIIRSILFRASYGGMHGDVKMFHWYATQVGQGAVPISIQPFGPVDPNILQQLPLDEVLINGADFHCFPQLIGMIHYQFMELSEQDIKRSIWECSSKTNMRLHQKVDTYWVTIWEKIKVKTVEFQTQLIQQKY
jgi:hypothetical protein